MTTLLSSKEKTERGSCSRTLVSRMKFFFKIPPAREGFAGDPGSTPSLAGGPAAGQVGRAGGAVPARSLGVVEARVGHLDQPGLLGAVIREGGDPQRERHAERPRLGGEGRDLEPLPDPLGDDPRPL